MGIYDREYYRREGPSFLGSIAERGKVCKTLIALNIVCFLLQMLTREHVPGGGWKEPFTDALLLDANKVMQGEVWRLLTCAFLHSPGSLLHILFNMLFLWWFGQQVEEDYGPREFLAFYLVSAIVSSVVFVAGAEVGLHGPFALGASGAVMAVLVLFALHYPRQVIYLFFVIPVPIWGVVVFMVVTDALNLFGGPRNNVAWTAHLGGAACGFLYYKLHLSLTGWLSAGAGWRKRRPAPSLRLYREEEPRAPVGVAAPASPSELDQLREEVDLILEKISLVGKEALTEHERQVLLRASEVLKRRRG
jgi:membrane associated rhomboid family serine protease